MLQGYTQIYMWNYFRLDFNCKCCNFVILTVNQMTNMLYVTLRRSTRENYNPVLQLYSAFWYLLVLINKCTVCSVMVHINPGKPTIHYSLITKRDGQNQRLVWANEDSWIGSKFKSHILLSGLVGKEGKNRVNILIYCGCGANSLW